MSKVTLSIIIPVYNEEKLVAASLPTIFALPINKEIIVVNDGSTDNTLTILKEINKKYPFKLIDLAINRGKGAAIKRGLKEINSDYFIVCDADLEYDPLDINKLLKFAQKENNNNLAVYGSRFLNNKNNSFHYFINSFLTVVTNVLFNGRLSDMETCFKLIPSTALKKIKLSSKRFEIEPEITAQLLKNNYQIKELPVSYVRRSYQEGKKITAKDGVAAIITLLREKFQK
jgi:glycosyltransferase involved in cell wall biosynthesis